MTVNEQHYTPSELAKKWHLSTDTVRRLCERHGGILVIDRPERMHKRGYRTFRIPQSAAEEIYRIHFKPSANRNKSRQWNKPVASGHQAMGDLNARPVDRPNLVFPAPEITIFTRHNRNCKHRRDEFFQHCDCPKSFSFNEFGGNRTLRSGTRSWQEAERIKQNAVSLVVTGTRPFVCTAITGLRSRMLLSLEEAAIQVGRTEEDLRKAIARNELFAWRFGKKVYLNPADLMPLS
jgi:hypothetical protein